MGVSSQSQVKVRGRDKDSSKIDLLSPHHERVPESFSKQASFIAEAFTATQRIT